MTRYIHFTKQEWANLRAATPMTLSEADLEELRGINEKISLSEVAQIYLPLSRLLNLYVAATQSLRQTTDTFLGNFQLTFPKVGIAGSVAVGKTTARIVQALLARWPSHPQVDLHDRWFLYQSVLENGLMNRKVPESYDVRRLLQFLAESNQDSLRRASRYSHQVYDIVPDVTHVVRQPTRHRGRSQRPPNARRPQDTATFVQFLRFLDLCGCCRRRQTMVRRPL
jgi:type I pantothenate kinase